MQWFYYLTKTRRWFGQEGFSSKMFSAIQRQYLNSLITKNMFAFLLRKQAVKQLIWNEYSCFLAETLEIIIEITCLWKPGLETNRLGVLLKSATEILLVLCVWVKKKARDCLLLGIINTTVESSPKYSWVKGQIFATWSLLTTRSVSWDKGTSSFMHC